MSPVLHRWRALGLLVIVACVVLAMIFFGNVTRRTRESGSTISGSGSISDAMNRQPDIDKANDEGIEFAETGKEEEAKAAFLRALMLDPGYPPTLSNLCALSIQMEKYTEAIDYCTRALERGPEFADAHYNLATVYIRTGDLAQAKMNMDNAAKEGRDVTELRAAIERKTLKN